MSKFYIREQTKLKLQLLPRKKQLMVLGKWGCLALPLYFPLVYMKEEKKLLLITSYKTKLSFIRLYHILLLQSAIGVLVSYKKQLTIVGIGYQVEIEDNKFLVFKLGYSHLVRVKIPFYVDIECPKPRIIKLRGIHYQKISNFACMLRRLRLPFTYKEKGIYFLGESVTLKQGKKT